MVSAGDGAVWGRCEGGCLEVRDLDKVGLRFSFVRLIGQKMIGSENAV